MTSVPDPLPELLEAYRTADESRRAPARRQLLKALSDAVNEGQAEVHAALRAAIGETDDYNTLVSLTRLQDRLGCPVITASQITTAPDGSRYTFGARAFEHSADTVVEIFREKDNDGRLAEEATLQTRKT